MSGLAATHWTSKTSRFYTTPIEKGRSDCRHLSSQNSTFKSNAYTNVTTDITYSLSAASRISVADSMGGVFVVETLSVMIQVASFKLTGKRVFRMAPIHHHFELKGWPEPRVIVRFWIISVVLVLVGLATLKVR
jgi:hypothetical protein